MIVDDRPVNREFLITLLGYQGHRLIEAANGAEGLKQARAEHPNLIITDVLMPLMDGYEFVRQLRAEPALASIPIIFYTAHYQEAEAQSLAQACGVPYLLPKPSKPQVVLEMVETALSSTLPPVPPPPLEAFDREHLRLLTNKLSEKVDELRRVNARLSALLNLSQELIREEKPARLLDKVCQVARKLTRVKYAGIGTLNEAKTALRYFITSGLEVETVTQLGQPPVGLGLLGSLLEEGPPLRRAGLEAGPEVAGLPLSHPPFRSFLAAPLLSPTRRYGWLYLAEKEGADEFNEEDELLATTLAAQVTLAYEKLLQVEEIQRHAVELQRSNAELERFAYVASHDLQEPLRMVASYCQLLERRYKDQLDEEANLYIAFAVDGAKRMQALIKGLLDYSRLHRQDHTFKPVDSQRIITQACANLQGAIQENGGQVTWETLPTVQGNPAQLLSLFQNLISNALKFRRDIPPRIHISAERTDEGWRFAVQDNGIGIEAAQNERIFALFQRLHTQTEYPGAGLGLALCRKIVQQHGGQLWVESQPGQGSTFYFTIPDQKEEQR